MEEACVVPVQSKAPAVSASKSGAQVKGAPPPAPASLDASAQETLASAQAKGAPAAAPLELPPKGSQPKGPPASTAKALPEGSLPVKAPPPHSHSKACLPEPLKDPLGFLCGAASPADLPPANMPLGPPPGLLPESLPPVPPFGLPTGPPFGLLPGPPLGCLPGAAPCNMPPAGDMTIGLLPPLPPLMGAAAMMPQAPPPQQQLSGCMPIAGVPATMPPQLQAGLPTQPSLGLAPPGQPCTPSTGSTAPMIGEKVQWEEHKSPQGVPYFYCKKTGKSSWVRPAGPLDVVVEAASTPAKAAAQTPAKAASAAAAAVSSGGGSVKEQLGEPESWESIGKTGWLRVETEKGFTYFYHKKKKKTSWTCPPEIAKEVAELDGVLGLADEPAAGKDAGTPEKKQEGGAAADSGEGRREEANEANKKDQEEEEKNPPQLSKAERVQKREEEQQAAKEKDQLRNFKQLLIEKGIKPFEKYEKWLPKLVHDPRFTAVPGKGRKLLFDTLAKRIDSERKKQQAASRRTGREAFKELVVKAEELSLLQDTTADKALRAMEDKFEDDDRWLAVPELTRERMVKEAVHEIGQRLEKEREEARDEFQAMVMQALKGKEQDPLSFSQLRRRFENDPRWERVASSDRERVYNRIVRELEEAQRKRKAQRRQVQLEAEEARKKRRLTEGQEKLLSIFNERIKNPFGMAWEEAREKLADLLQSRGLLEVPQEEQERAWAEYERQVEAARVKQFSRMLADAGFDVAGPELEFQQILQRIFDAAAAKDFQGMPQDVLHGAWEEWRGHAYGLAIEDCQKWLRTCEHLRGCEDVDLGGGDDFDQLMEKLRTKDIRFSRLDGRPEEQTRLLIGRLRELREQRAKAKSGKMGEDDED